MSIVQLVKPEDQTSWKIYIEEKNLSHHAYNWNWQFILEEVFKQKAYYFAAKEGNKIVGILPLFHLKSRLFGNSLISIPYLNAGGIIANSSEIQEQLVKVACKLGEKLAVNYLELRQKEQLIFEDADITSRSHKVSMQLKLKSNPEELFSSFSPKLRSQIRRPSKSAMFAEVFSNSTPNYKAINAFYKVFSEHMRDLGTPVYPKKLFTKTIDSFGENSKTIIVWLENKPVAAGITIGQGSSTEIPWAAALKAYNTQSPNMLLYWEAIKQACLDGFKTFDFGRSSPESGPYRFKAQWGAVPLPLHWYYKVFFGIAPDVNPNSPKFSFLVNCWKKLPLSVANIIGPIITKGIP